MRTDSSTSDDAPIIPPDRAAGRANRHGWRDAGQRRPRRGPPTRDSPITRSIQYLQQFVGIIAGIGVVNALDAFFRPDGYWSITGIALFAPEHGKPIPIINCALMLMLAFRFYQLNSGYLDAYAEDVAKHHRWVLWVDFFAIFLECALISSMSFFIYQVSSFYTLFALALAVDAVWAPFIALAVRAQQVAFKVEPLRGRLFKQGANCPTYPPGHGKARQWIWNNGPYAAVYFVALSGNPSLIFWGPTLLLIGIVVLILGVALGIRNRAKADPCLPADQQIPRTSSSSWASSSASLGFS